MAQHRGSRSSLHYDPYHNLLCVVAGSKIIRALSPAATRWVYPLPLHGESANHSGVNFAAPDLAAHSLYAHAQAAQLTAELQVRRFLNPTNFKPFHCMKHGTANMPSARHANVIF